MVASGKNADFLVLDANPLDNIANTRRISRVYLRGREVDRAALRAQLEWRVCSGAGDLVADYLLKAVAAALQDRPKPSVVPAPSSAATPSVRPIDPNTAMFGLRS